MAAYHSGIAHLRPGISFEDVRRAHRAIDRGNACRPLVATSSLHMGARPNTTLAAATKSDRARDDRADPGHFSRKSCGAVGRLWLPIFRLTPKCNCNGGILLLLGCYPGQKAAPDAHHWIGRIARRSSAVQGE